MCFVILLFFVGVITNISYSNMILSVKFIIFLAVSLDFNFAIYTRLPSLKGFRKV